jgi:condensin complex subunit 3
MNEIAAVFTEAQRSVHAHNKLHQKLIQLRTKLFPSDESFFDAVFNTARHSLIVWEREPVVDRVIDFTARLAAKFVEPFDAVSYLLKKLLVLTDCGEKSVRFRSTQLIGRLLDSMDAEGQLDDDLWESLQSALLTRIRDKIPGVRGQAVGALERLQDPTNPHCPVTEAYIQLVDTDSSPEVRKAVLEHIAVQSLVTKECVITRTRDTNETVRKMAFQLLGKQVTNIKSYTISERIQLLQDGLSDRSESVRKACCKSLLHSWLESIQYNACELLDRLDVENSSDVCQLVINEYFKSSAPTSLVSQFIELGIVEQNSERPGCNVVMKPSELTSPLVMYWRCLCQHLTQLKEQDLLDSVLPDASAMCQFINSFVDEHVTSDVVRMPELALTVEFTLKQLLVITSLCDLSDEVARRSFLGLLHSLLLNVSLPLGVFETIAEQMLKLNNEKECTEEMISIISEIEAPLDADSNDSQSITLSQSVALDDPQAILRCLTITCEFLKRMKLCNLSASLRSLHDLLVLPAVQNEDPVIRTQAITALGLLTMCDASLARQHVVLFLQAAQLDNECVQLAALCTLFDLILIFGFNCLLECPKQEETEDIEEASNHEQMTESDEVIEGPESNAGEEAGNTTEAILSILSNLLDSDSSDVLTLCAEGVAKLLLNGHLVSKQLLSHLILLWYNPTSQELTRLRGCLGTFFPMYALSSRQNQKCVGEVVVPVMKTLFDCPAMSPLVTVDVNNVAQFLTQLTDPEYLQCGNDDSDDGQSSDSVHGAIAIEVCQETLSGSADEMRCWLKLLNMLHIPTTETVSYHVDGYSISNS